MKEAVYRKLPDYPSDYLDFASNDYLGLAGNHEVIEAGYKEAVRYGAGSTGSRLLSGNKEIFCEFEELIAKDKQTESALIFNSGFQANSGVLECLCDSKTTVIFDKLNHASMYQGIFASKAKLLRYNHLDYGHLEGLLQRNSAAQIIIASETVFGMDGDMADLKILSELSGRYDTVLYLDEAHATGLYGKHGYGVSTDYSLDMTRTIIMGTFSKALGSSGAYIACSSLFKDYFIQKCRSFIYSTALSPFCIGAALCSWKLIRTLRETRQKIMNNSESLRNSLKNIGKNVIGAETNIVPIVFDDINSMQTMKNKCLQNGMIVSGIMRPTSPTPRIRIAINANHTQDDIKRLLNVMAKK